MSAFVKTKLKAAREALNRQENERALDAALGALEYEPENYNAYVPPGPTTLAVARGLTLVAGPGGAGTCLRGWPTCGWGSWTRASK